MKKQLFILALGLFYFVSCGTDSTKNSETSTAETATETQSVSASSVVNNGIEPQGFIYESESYEPGDDFQYAQVWINQDKTKILGLWLWTDSEPKKLIADLSNLDISMVTESSFFGSGEFNDPKTQIPYRFKVMYESFRIELGDDNFIDFFYETEEWK